MALNLLLTDRVLHRLEALRAAWRRVPARYDRSPCADFEIHATGPNTADIHRVSPGRQDCPICRELPAFQPGGIVQRPAPVHFNAPCRFEPVMERVMIDMAEGPVTVLRECVRAAGIPDDLVDEASFRIVNSAYAERVASSYTVETAALDDMRRAMNERLDGEVVAAITRASYAPAERPTAACSACPALVPPEELWVGKKSGIALCDPCMAKWEQAGRAKRTGEF